MGLQSLLYYAALTWLAPLYVDAGWSAGRAGLLLGLFSFTQIFSALAVPALADRTGDHRPWLALSVGTATVMLAAFGLAPTAAPWLWAALLGLGVGGMFALALTLLVKLAPTPAEAASLSGMALLVGYLLAATGPVLAGALYDAAGPTASRSWPWPGSVSPRWPSACRSPRRPRPPGRSWNPGVAEPVPISEAQPATPERQDREVPRSWTSGW
jgi:CP family cyanate transporter-like MFS transporter